MDQGVFVTICCSTSADFPKPILLYLKIKGNRDLCLNKVRYHCLSPVTVPGLLAVPVSSAHRLVVIERSTGGVLLPGFGLTRTPALITSWSVG